MDFFTVPTLTFNVLSCFFMISQDRRRILHFNVSRHPTSNWIVQQLREAFPYETVPKFLVFDHDAKYGFAVPKTAESMQITPVRTSIGSPWQNGVAERWVGSCRRELLDHVIALNERHLKRLLSDYVSYYHQDRTHLGIGKQTPAGRAPPVGNRQVICHRRLAGCIIGTTGLLESAGGAGYQRGEKLQECSLIHRGSGDGLRTLVLRSGNCTLLLLPRVVLSRRDFSVGSSGLQRGEGSDAQLRGGIGH